MKNKLIISVILLMLSVKIGNAQQQHEYVDLGLPSGTLWATCNVGADNPWEYGDYFAWGEIEPSDSYSWDAYKYANGDRYKLIKYCTDSFFGIIDDKITLECSDDAANQIWGENWCMPTQQQFEELIDNCTWVWTTMNGKNGYEVKGKNNKIIFLPAAGYQTTQLINEGSLGLFWSSSLSEDCSTHARYLSVPKSYNAQLYNGARILGYSVRPVRRGN